MPDSLFTSKKVCRTRSGVELRFYIGENPPDAVMATAQAAQADTAQIKDAVVAPVKEYGPITLRFNRNGPYWSIYLDSALELELVAAAQNHGFTRGESAI